MNIFIDSGGVLVCYSEEETNGTATIAPAAADDGEIREAGKWQWDGNAWITYPAPTAP